MVLQHARHEVRLVTQPAFCKNLLTECRVTAYDAHFLWRHPARFPPYIVGNLQFADVVQQPRQNETRPVLLGPTQPPAHQSGQDCDMKAMMQQIIPFAIHIVKLRDCPCPIAEFVQIAVGDQLADCVEVDPATDRLGIENCLQLPHDRIVCLHILRIQESVLRRIGGLAFAALLSCRSDILHR